MIYYPVSALINAVTSTVLGILAYYRNRKNPVNIGFTLFALSVAFWSYCYFLWQLSAEKSLALFWCRALMMGAIFIPVCYLQFVLALLDVLSEKKKIIIEGYVLAAIFLALDFTPLFVKDVEPRMGFRFWPIAGVTYAPFLAMFFSYVIYAWYLMFKALRTYSGIKANQIKYVLLGTAIGFIGGSTNYPLWYNIHVPPLGNGLVAVYIVTVAYAIVTYRLMDITFEIRDVTIRLASSLIPAAVFIAIGMAFFSPAVMIAMIVLTAIASPLLYRPLRRLLMPVILGGRYEYQQKLRRISDKWFSIFSLDRLSEALVKDVANAIGMNYCNFMIYDEEGKSYFVKADAGFKERKEGEDIEEVSFKEEGPLVSYLKKEKTIAIKEVLKIQPPFSEHDPVVKEMDRVKAAISVPLYIDDELKGILNLGDKASREMYNRQDLEILSQIAKDAEVMFRYSFFNYEQSLLVYRYSHDLRTPLDPVQTYLYLMEQGKLNEEEKEKYLKIVRKNIDFVAQGLSDMYQLSQMAYDHIRKKFVFGHFNITEMVKRIVEDFTPEAKKKDIYLRFSGKKQMPLAYGHEQSIERLIRNLIQNGIKFTDKGGVEVNVSSEKEDIRIKVSDTGQGIPKKDLPKIFNPFFKTKGRDQIVEGSGLGLTIVREIVALHGGEINVESEVGKGTTFTVLLPAPKKRKI